MGEGKLKKKDESWIFKAVAVESFLVSLPLFLEEKNQIQKMSLSNH